MIFTSPTGEAQKRTVLQILTPIDSGLSYPFVPPSVALICQTTTSSYIFHKILPSFLFNIHPNHFSHPEEEVVHSCKMSEHVATAQCRNPRRKKTIL
jgi:hypothetical protein